MKDFSAFLDMGRYMNWSLKIGFWKYLSEDLSYQFFPSQSTESLISALLPALLSGGVENQQLQQHVI